MGENYVEVCEKFEVCYVELWKILLVIVDFFHIFSRTGHMLTKHKMSKDLGNLLDANNNMTAPA